MLKLRLGLNLSILWYGKCYHDNEIFNNINDKKNGEYISYYTNGQLYEICNYIDGKINGEHKSYYNNGQLIVIC